MIESMVKHNKLCFLFSKCVEYYALFFNTKHVSFWQNLKILQKHLINSSIIKVILEVNLNEINS